MTIPPAIPGWDVEQMSDGVGGGGNRTVCTINVTASYSSTHPIADVVGWVSAFIWLPFDLLEWGLGRRINAKLNNK